MSANRNRMWSGLTLPRLPTGSKARKGGRRDLTQQNGKLRRQVHKRLTHLDAIRVATWLRENKQVLNEQFPTRQRTSEMIEKALGIAVHDQTLERIGRSVGIKFQASRATRLGSVLIVAKAVAELYGRLGEPVPEPLGGLLVRANFSGTIDVGESDP